MIGSRFRHFEVEKLLGSGGMGEVYLAVDTNLERRVALKFLPRSLTGDRTAQARLLDEARSCSRVQHPNVAVIHSVEEDGGVYAICMEYVEGMTLREIILHQQLGLTRITEIAMGIARGISSAHELGIIHRDIKPANVIITPKGEVKVMDFGLALRPERSVKTTGPESFGTVAYMSPEQARGAELTKATDIFSFGSMLYELITGRLPFTGENDLAVLHAIIANEPVAVRELRRDVAPALERMVRFCMSKAPSDRYPNMDQVVEVLERLTGVVEQGPKDLISELSTGLESDALKRRVTGAVPPVRGGFGQRRPDPKRRTGGIVAPSRQQRQSASTPIPRAPERRATPKPTATPAASKRSKAPTRPGGSRAAASRASRAPRNSSAELRSGGVVLASGSTSDASKYRGKPIWKTLLGLVFALALAASVVFGLTQLIQRSHGGASNEGETNEATVGTEAGEAPAKQRSAQRPTQPQGNSRPADKPSVIQRELDVEALQRAQSWLAEPPLLELPPAPTQRGASAPALGLPSPQFGETKTAQTQNTPSPEVNGDTSRPGNDDWDDSDTDWP